MIAYSCTPIPYLVELPLCPHWYLYLGYRRIAIDDRDAKRHILPRRFVQSCLNTRSKFSLPGAVPSGLLPEKSWLSMAPRWGVEDDRPEQWNVALYQVCFPGLCVIGRVGIDACGAD